MDSNSRIGRLYRWAESSDLDFPGLDAINKLLPVKRVFERHRHRFEVNPEFHRELQKTGLQFSGWSPDKRLVEFCELPPEMHCYFVATQAHPEFKSRPNRAHPLFAGLVAAAKQRKQSGDNPVRTLHRPSARLKASMG
jgi:CTP synthase (UTP-ammonia lyase)